MIKYRGSRPCPLRGASGLHKDFFEIDFLVVSGRGEV